MGTQRAGQTAGVYQFINSKIWLRTPDKLYGDHDSNIPIYDAGCFLDPTVQPFYDLSGFPAIGLPDLSVGDIVFSLFRCLPDGIYVEPFPSAGNFECLVAGDSYFHTWLPDNRYFKRLSYGRPTPAAPWTWSDHGWTVDAWEVGQLVYDGGKYYKCIQANMWKPLTDAAYWEEVSAPDPKWDSFAGFGGKGELDTFGCTPQIYTVAFHGIEDNESAAHPLNGIYYARKMTGVEEDFLQEPHGSTCDVMDTNFWRMLRYRPGQKTYRCDFKMYTGEYASKATTIKLEQLWLHTNTYSADRVYNEGESLIIDGADLIQRCFTAKVPHSGHEPPDGAYWIEQAEPWETWSETYLFAVDEYCLHFGELYKSKSEQAGHEPPNETYWEHVTEDHANYPAYQTIFTASTTENYGCAMDKKAAVNETEAGDKGFNGTASVYPGEIEPWNPDKTDYAAGNIICHNGYFYQSAIDNPDTEPPSAQWTLLGH